MEGYLREVYIYAGYYHVGMHAVQAAQLYNDEKQT